MYAPRLAVALAVVASLALTEAAAAAGLPNVSRTPPPAPVLKGLLESPPPLLRKPRSRSAKRRVRAARSAALRGIDAWTLGDVEPAGNFGDKQFFYLVYWQWSSKIRSYVLWWDLWVCAGGACARTTVSYFSFYWGGWYGPFGPFRV